MRPITRKYAALPILEGFNWSECLAEVDAARFYLVIFRSVRRETADPIRLKAYDDRAYAEAREQSGLLLYFRGGLNHRRECLSFCIWENQEQAQAATQLAAHEAAAQLTDEMYASFVLERWILTKRPGSSSLELYPASGDVAWTSSAVPTTSIRSDGASPGADGTGWPLPESSGHSTDVIGPAILSGTGTDAAG